MNRRYIGFFGIGAWLLFWLASIVLAALRPSYSHVANTISELGAIGTPNATLWNVFGFVVPGILLAVTGATIAHAANADRSVSRTLAIGSLLLSGLAIAGQGVMPAAMANGIADVTDASTRGHFISSLISGGAWALGVLLLLRPMRRNPFWRDLHVVSAALVVLTFGAAIGLRGMVPDGLAQRIGNAGFCAWFILMSWRLVRLDKRAGAAAPETTG